MRITGLLAFAMASASVGANAQNLLVNGGFDLGPRDIGGVLNVAAGSNLIPGWTVSGAGVDLVTAPLWSGSRGTAASIDLSLLNAGGISQRVQTGFATQYRLSFDISASPDLSPPNKDMRVTIGNGGQNIVRNYSPAASGVPNQVNWATQNIDFKSFSSTTTISFESLTNTPYGPNVDSVSLEAVGIWSRFFQLTGRNTGIKFNFTVPEVTPPPPPPAPPVVTYPVRPRLVIPARVVTVVEPAGPIQPRNEKAELVADIATNILTFALGFGTKTPKGFADPPKVGRPAGPVSFSAPEPEGFDRLIEIDLSILEQGDFGTMQWRAGNFAINGSYISDAGTFTDEFDVTSQLVLAPMNNFAVPEPASWAMLIAGFGLIGAVARRRRGSLAAA